MSKQLRISDPGRGAYRGSAKKVGHGSYKAKRRPNSPMVLRKEREKNAAKYGQDPEFRAAMYPHLKEEASTAEE